MTIVAPTEHLKTQWAEAAARVGIHIDPKFSNSSARHSSEYDGVALTYAQVASKPALHRTRTESAPTLVILDEIHHGGDALSWGDAIREAFEPAARRLALTGTPFRSDTSPIPFVTYAEDRDGIRRSSADYTYGYAEALRDGVVRPVLFLAYGGAMRWRTKAGDEIAARLGELLTKDSMAQAWRTALDPKGEWIPSVLAAADKRLTEVRRGVPDAGGLVIASNQTAARAYARILEAITGEKPTLVLSDDAGSSARIEEYAASESRWMVAVRMVSEGVDVPRLCVGVYATSTSTPLFFAQAVGRFVRARRRGETASVFLPSVPVILEHAARLEDERDHALDRVTKDDSAASMWAEEDALLDAANRTARTPDVDQMAFEALESDAEFDHVLFDAKQFGLNAVTGLGRGAGVPRPAGPARAGPDGGPAARAADRAEHPPAPQGGAARSRRTARSRPSARSSTSWSRPTPARRARPHGVVHNELRRACGGPALDEATSEQVVARVEKIRAWFVGRR